MASHVSTEFKSIVSTTRIMFGLLPGLGAMIIIRMAIHLYRPDIEDAQHRVRPVDKLHDCYDFIIVGGGSAGAVLASRLSENPDWNVLLLEAGQDENVLSEVPVLFPVLQTSSIDWQFVTESSDQYCLSMVDKRCKWPRGKVLGGSSVLNAMLYIRGNKRDYDSWEYMGNPGWSYEEVLPYFLKSEDMRIPEYQADTYHATGGPLTIEYFKYEQPITRKILEAGQQLGYKLLDVNGEYQTGFTRSHATIRDGLRCSTAKGFLRPAAKRPNLHVSVHSLVQKVLIDENKRAYGVLFSKHGHSQIIKANREVILSAGAIQSPQLLMLSGIGDAEHLKETGIYPIVNLPGVGNNLQDHVAMGGHSFLFDNPYKNGTDFCFNMNTVFSIGSLIDFTVHKQGLFYSMMEAEAMAFVNTKYQTEEDYPDIQLFIAPTADNMDGGLFGKRANGLTDETYAELYEDILYDSSFSVVPLLLRPKSRGYIKLRDSNPFSPPRIYANYFSDPGGEDVKTLVEGARIVQALVEQPALKELNARPNPNRNPGCAGHELMSEEHLECQARHHSLTIYHPVGTCKMGPPEDLTAVVDPRLRVYGIKNLRVVDGSVMPTITSGNTNAPIIMIAEKASDMIKQDWSETPVEPICSTEYRVTYSKNSENDNTQVDYDRPDLFNETTSLFVNLPKDMIPTKPSPVDSAARKKPETSEDNDGRVTLLSRENEAKSKGLLQPEQDVQNSCNLNVPVNYNPAQTDYYPLLSPYPYLARPNYFIPPPPPPLYAYGASPVVYPGILNSGIQPPIYNLFAGNPANRNKPFGSKFKNNSPLNNLFRKQYFPPVQDKTGSLYYETKEEITPRGEKKCKIWLYYDGLKYEVML